MHREWGGVLGAPEMGQKESVDEARGSARPLTVAREGRQGGKGVVSLSSRAAPRRQAPGETRARELSGGHRKDGGGSIEGGRWPGHEERPDFEVEKRSSAVGSGGCGTIRRGPFLMARSSLSRAWAAASLTGVLRGSRTRWVEGKGGEQDEEERTLTVTRSQRAGPRNGRLQGWTTGAQRTCVRSHKRAVCDRARRSRHSRSADELAAGRGRRVLAHTASIRHSTGERASHGSNHPPKGTTVPKGGGRSSPIHDVSHPRAGVTGACIRTRFGGGGGMGMSPLRVDPRHRVAIRLLGHGHIKA